MEAHGPHLPIGTDAFIALALSRLTAGYAGAAGREALVAPPFYWGVNGVLADFVGSFRVRPETAAMLLEDVIGSLVGFGFGEVLIISHHGDLAHNEMIRDVLLGLHGAGIAGARWLYTPFRWRMFARLGMTGQEPIWAPWTPTPGLEAFRLTGVFGVHADEYETAAMVRYFPHTVDFEALRDLPPTALTAADLPRWRKGGAEARALTPDSYFGAPTPSIPNSGAISTRRQRSWPPQFRAVVAKPARSRSPASCAVSPSASPRQATTPRTPAPPCCGSALCGG